MADKDYIERSKAMEHRVITDIGIWSGFVVPVKAIENIPTADVRPVVHAKWIVKQDDECWWVECSNCGNEPGRDKYRNDWLSPFCPSCGAEMFVDKAVIS